MTTMDDSIRRASLSLAVFLALTAGACSPSDSADDADAAPGGAIEFSDLRVEEIAADRAVVRFDTSVPSSCEVEYGPAMDQLNGTATDPDMEPGQLALDHDVPLEDLDPETTYYLRAVATDGDGQTAYSNTIQFATTAADDPTAGLTNVALLAQGTTVVAVSSNFGGGDNDSTWGVHRALDGLMNTEWATAGDGDDAFVSLDFGQTRTLSHFAYRSRMMNDGTSIVTRVQLLVDGQVVLGPVDTPEHQERYVFEFDPALETREIRFEAVETTSGNTGAKEIQLFIR